MVASFVGALELPLLGKKVGERALPAEDVASRTGDGVSGNLEAQTAGAEG